MQQKKGFTRNRILGTIGILWGGGILLSKALGAQPTATNQAYAAGQTGAYIFALLLLVVGIYYAVKG
jgi:hypothetical protein